jgi:hypothetical protein
VNSRGRQAGPGRRASRLPRRGPIGLCCCRPWPTDRLPLEDDTAPLADRSRSARGAPACRKLLLIIPAGQCRTFPQVRPREHIDRTRRHQLWRLGPDRRHVDQSTLARPRRHAPHSRYYVATGTSALMRGAGPTSENPWRVK